jgi:hypothetical protein
MQSQLASHFVQHVWTLEVLFKHSSPCFGQKLALHGLLKILAWAVIN